MLNRADPKLWVSVGANYNGFAFKPSKGWLLNANQKTRSKCNRQTAKGQSAIHRLPSTTIDVR